MWAKGDADGRGDRPGDDVVKAFVFIAGALAVLFGLVFGANYLYTTYGADSIPVAGIVFVVGLLLVLRRFWN